jgi:CRP/FNR family cyclic AMP-dependent transcriptional regulator
MPIEERLQSQDVFGFLTPNQVDSISNAAQTVRFKAGDVVYSQGEPAESIYVVLEGEVLLRLPGKGGISVPLDVVTPGAMFGSCLCFGIESYSTTAQCTQDSKLLKIKAAALSSLMDEDLRMGYTMQRRLSQIYFNRYLNTMGKLQTVVMSLPVEAR